MVNSNTLIVFARAPELGRVKTRLAADIGASAALAAYLDMGRHSWTAACDRRSSNGYRAVVAFTPANLEPIVRDWLVGADAYIAQSDGDLGERMLAAVVSALDEGAPHVLVIGTDCPAMSPSVITDAFDALDGADLVVGPSTDGGYYLIGMSGAHEDLFTGVPWSSPRTLAVTLERAHVAGLRVAQLGLLSDVDTVDDWRLWLASGRALVVPAGDTGR